MTAALTEGIYDLGCARTSCLWMSDLVASDGRLSGRHVLRSMPALGPELCGSIGVCLPPCGWGEGDVYTWRGEWFAEKGGPVGFDHDMGDLTSEVSMWLQGEGPNEGWSATLRVGEGSAEGWIFPMTDRSEP